MTTGRINQITIVKEEKCNESFNTFTASLPLQITNDFEGFFPRKEQRAQTTRAFTLSPLALSSTLP